MGHDDADTVKANQPSTDEASNHALIDEAMKKSGLIWVYTPRSPGGRALWHVWLEGNAYVLTRVPDATTSAERDAYEQLGANTEQPDPGLADGATVWVVVRSKDDAHRLISLAVKAHEVRPHDPDWSAASSELAKSRLNLRDPEDAPRRWAPEARFRIYRLTPTGEVGERPGSYDSTAHRAAPVVTPATTAGKPPRVLHRRGHHGRPLS